MSKVAVVYWSGTGNTEAMANAVAEGAKEKGAEVTLFTASEFSSAKVAEFDGIAFGCPAMGAENLEESEFEPMFTDCEAALSGKKITSNRTALAKLTGVPPLHGSHVAILIACDGFITLGLLTVWEYHYHDKNVVAGNPAKDCFSDH